MAGFAKTSANPKIRLAWSASKHYSPERFFWETRPYDFVTLSRDLFPLM